MTTHPDLEKRVQALEDRLEIIQLIMSYPLALDSGAEKPCRAAWAENGVFDRGSNDPAEHSGGYQGAYGVETIIEEFNGPALQHARDRGLAHLMTAPHLAIHGNKAVATNYNQLVEREGNEFHTTRVTANRWELVRQNGKWVIERRVLRLLTGARDAREVLGQELG
jgi:SnoaL-like domain